MEPIFETVTVCTEERLHILYSSLYKKNTRKQLLIFLACMVLSVWLYISLDIEKVLTYTVFVAVYAFLVVGTITQPRRLAKKRYLQELEYYDNCNPPMTLRFYEDHFVTESIDSRHVSPYSKLSRVEFKKDLVMFLRKDELMMWMSTDTFTKGTLEDFLRFIREKAPQAFPQPPINTQK